jgi:hypothetical protein
MYFSYVLTASSPMKPVASGSIGRRRELAVELSRKFCTDHSYIAAEA